MLKGIGGKVSAGLLVLALGAGVSGCARGVSSSAVKREPVGATGTSVEVSAIPQAADRAPTLMPEETASATQEPTAAPTPVSEPPPRQVIIDPVRPELFPADLRNRLGFSGYKFYPGSRPAVSLKLINLQAEKNIDIELATRFIDDTNERVVETEWSRMRLAPGSSHQYLADTSNPRATKGIILLRLVTEKNP